MSVSIRIIKPVGVLNSITTAKITQEINEMIGSGIGIVLLDLQEVPFIDSSGLGALIIAFKNLRSAGGKLYFCSITDPVRMLFELTSTDQVFEIFASQDEFFQVMMFKTIETAYCLN